MSFILDALKRSESERLRKRSPDISDVPVAGKRRNTAVWAWLIGALLAVNAIVVTALLLRSQPGLPPSPPAAKYEAEPVTRSKPLHEQSAARTDSDSRVAAPTPAAAAPQSESVARPEPKTEPSTQPASVTAAPPAQRSRPVETLLTFQDVKASGSVDLADLHIDLHVYSESPADRFVFINMNQYRESGVLAEGPTLREITPEGVVLEYRGTMFLLPRE
jgi:general secretion pathway protein B